MTKIGFNFSIIKLRAEEVNLISGLLFTHEKLFYFL